ncbi:hypothetical protein EV182_004074 [Spiromyces aspiralis]|uniref:Uncharacterized protein n=1 Tax=Spiromyces aspiralis TaxID=68401 RepID=A0ACC1HPF9_9FUNG|nr:hypothetical protein EV182_004074 [Spiromyces aspiralis]
MIRDKFVCSDLLNSLVEVLYESGSTAMPWPKPQSTQAEAEGGAVTRPHQIINHDVEWAMHHLRRQVFLKPSTFAYLKDKYGATALGPEDDRESTVAAADNQTKTAKPSGAQKVPLAPASPWLDCVRQRELGSLWQELHLSGCDRGGPGAMIDPASGDNVIIDKVTYEFLKLYHCIGWIPKYPARAASAQGLYQQPIGLPGLQPRTVVATQHFLYLVRERVDVWPPPAATLTRFYRQWQTAEPPMIVTSDPDSYDPESITELLQARSRANSSAASSTISALTRTSSASNTPLSSSLERTWPASSSLPAPLPITLSLENMCEWTAEHISQYDRVERVRPVECLNNIEVRPLNLIVKPSPQPGLSSGENNGSSAKGGAKASGDDDYTMELEKWGLDKRLVMGCTATGWSTLVRLAFKPLVSVRPDLDPDMLDHSQDKGLQQQYSVWDLFFATSSSANDFIESIKALTSKIDMPEIRVSTAGEGN